MDLKDPKNQKIILGIFILLLIIYVWYSKVYSKYSQEITRTQTEYEYALTNLKRIELKCKSIDKLKEEYAKLLEEYKNVELLLPEEKQIPLFLNQMHSAAQASQTKITQILPHPSVPMDFYSANDFGVELTGSYHHLGSFLANVANFPFIANVNNMKIVGSAPQTQRETVKEQSKETITASLVLTTYNIKEEGKLKKVEF